MKMGFIHSLNLYILCLIYLKGTESAKVYVIDIPYTEDDLRNYDDYDDPLNELDYSIDNLKKPEKLKSAPNFQTFRFDQKPRSILAKCHRMFGSLYDNKKQLRLCLKSLQRKNTIAMRQKKSAFKTLTNFSNDYFDIDDLARSQFSNDYVDVGDLREYTAKTKCQYDEAGNVKNCKPPSRKDIPAKAADEVTIVKERATSSDSEEQPRKKRKPKRVVTSSEEEKPRKKHKSKKKKVVASDSEDTYVKKKYVPKRYQVVSAIKSNRYSDENHGSDKYSSENQEFYHKLSTESVELDSNSIETSTRKPYKHKLKMLEEDDKFVYLQGNKYYPISSFRRRLPHFLPKRYHWREDQYKNLGYFWFNGPRGIPVPVLD